MKILLIIALLISGCDKYSANPANATYFVSDLEGVWSGDITIIGAPNSGIYPCIISFDDQGNCIESLGSTSVEGNLAVSGNGEITGIITVKYDTEFGEETANMNFEGSMFIAKTQISLDVSDCNWSNTSGNSGSYSVTGNLAKSTEFINCISTQIATINVDGEPSDWSSLSPAVTDPEGDSMCGTDTDIKHIYTAIDDNYAYVMVETYNKPIHSTATIEINFSFEAGELHTNISDTEVNAWKPTPDTYPINEEIVIRGSVIEIKIPLTQLANTTYFNPTFINIWDYNYSIENSGCEPTSVYCINN